MPSRKAKTLKLKSPTQQLLDVDQQAVDIVKKAISQAVWTYRSTLLFHALAQLLPVSLIGTGLYFIIFQPLNSINLQFAVFCFISGVVALITVLSQSPYKTVKNLMLNAMKLNIVYSGYARQIHQVDVVFKELCSRSGEINPSELEELLKYLQDAINEALNAISEVSNDLE